MTKIVVTEVHFNAIKSMQAVDIPNEDIAQIVGCSPTTVERAKRSDTWADYKALVADLSRRKEERQQDQKPDDAPDLMSLLKQVTKDLETIKHDLAKVPKRRLF